MGSIVYALCTVTSFICAALLMRRYTVEKHRLLLWSGLCFCGLTLNNVLLFADYILVPDVSLALARSLVAAFSMLLLLIGLIWDAD
ncbi:hypothetical protein BH24ACI5_BH24ACI5_24740 [soil metagenome]|jgi:hypothetical protein